MTDGPPTLRPCGFVAESCDDPLGHGPAPADRLVLAGAHPVFRQQVEGTEMRQGAVPSCNPKSFSDAVFVTRRVAGEVLMPGDAPSVAFLYREALLRGGWRSGDPLSGVAFSWLVDAFNSAGYPTEDEWPYDAGAILAGKLSPPLAAFRGAWDQRGAVRMHPVPRDAGAIKAHLLGGFQLVAGIETRWLDERGEGAHAVRPAGWNESGLEIRNPWGPEWDTTIPWEAVVDGLGIWAIDSVRRTP